MKLRLHRETLRNLATGELYRAKGGDVATTQYCDQGSDCACPTDTGCPGPSLESLCQTDRCSYYGNCSGCC